MILFIVLFSLFSEGCSQPPWPEVSNARQSLVAFQNVCHQSVDLDESIQKPCNELTENDLINDQYALAFWKKHFNVSESKSKALVTAYYTPEIEASLEPIDTMKTPIYRLPNQCSDCYSRNEIEQGALSGQGLELVYVKDPIERYFLQIQGSAMIRLPSGEKKRLVFSGFNQRPYQPLKIAGTMQNQKKWLKNHPDRLIDALSENPRFIFFNLIDDGNIQGCTGTTLMPNYSIAVDRKVYPIGTPIVLDHRIVIAQDVGSAINGANHFDMYLGTGLEAGKKAGGYVQHLDWHLLNVSD
ncbi:MAG: hypothetical protein CMF41_00535 [Legionellales bacterium]|nr:hypothetical protein [Legionellales bacterium]